MSPLLTVPLARPVLALILVLGAGQLLGCGEDSPQEPAASEASAGWREGTSQDGAFAVAWRPVGGSIPFNEPFELDVRVRGSADGAPIAGAEVRVAANMPEHGHGMLREPGWEELEQGNYRITGMLMHMTGHWVLSIDVVVGGQFETAEFAIELE